MKPQFSLATSMHMVSDSDLNKSIPIPTLKPGRQLAPKVKLSLTAGYISIFGIIFLIAYVQLWMIWYYRHKRLSHQTLFLYLCLIWSGFRTSLFSLYFNDCSTPNDNLVLYCLLYVFPVCLQFSMLCLLLHYFAQVVFKSRAKYEPRQYKRPLRVFLILSVVLFSAMNIGFAIVTKQYRERDETLPDYILYSRVSLTESMFLIYGVLFSGCIFQMSTVAASRRVLEAKGTTVCKAVIVNILIIILFLSRAIYNLITISQRAKRQNPNFGYDWINVSDQADEVTYLSEGLSYVSFGIVLFVWEVLPISIVLIFFRVQRLRTSQVMTDFSGQNSGTRVFFFDNPRRYDSIDDLPSHEVPSSHFEGSSVRSSSGVRSSLSTGGSVNASLPRSFPSPSLHHGVGHISDNSKRLMYSQPFPSYGSVNTIHSSRHNQ